MPPRGRPTYPNLPEITKTTLPLLCTVLAGFAVTMLAQLFTKNSIQQSWPPADWILFLGLSSLSISVPLFLASTIFAVWGQRYNYQHLTPELRDLLNIEDVGFQDYIDKLDKRWSLWHGAADRAFMFGLVTFVLGVDFLLESIIGLPVFLVFSSMTLACAIIALRLRKKDKDIGERFSPLPNNSPR